MAKRDKLTTKNGQVIDCNIVGFVDGIDGRKIIVYTTADNERELLASYYNLDGNKFRLEEIENDKEWDILEKRFEKLLEEFNKNRKNNI